MLSAQGPMRQMARQCRCLSSKAVSAGKARHTQFSFRGICAVSERQNGYVSPAAVQIRHGGRGNEADERIHKSSFMHEFDQNESFRNSMAYSLSFADSGDVVDAMAFSKLPSDLMREQLSVAALFQSEFDHQPLPRTVEEALRSSNRAVVITETERPFKVVDVNQAWEGLCGYSFVESQGKSLGNLLRGAETDASAVTALVAQLLRGEEAGTVLTNYKKDGTKFQNHIRVGPLMNKEGRLSHYVGILQEIH